MNHGYGANINLNPFVIPLDFKLLWLCCRRSWIDCKFWNQGKLEEPFGLDFLPHYFTDAYLGGRMTKLKSEERSLGGTQDWGKRSSASRPLRMGKQMYYFNKWSPISNKEFN